MLAGLEMPPAIEAERVLAAVLADLRSSEHRGVFVDSPPDASRIAVGAAHPDQVAVIQSTLDEAGAGITVDTANCLQGRKYELTIVLHPLSGDGTRTRSTWSRDGAVCSRVGTGTPASGCPERGSQSCSTPVRRRSRSTSTFRSRFPTAGKRISR